MSPSNESCIHYMHSSTTKWGFPSFIICNSKKKAFHPVGCVPPVFVVPEGMISLPVWSHVLSRGGLVTELGMALPREQNDWQTGVKLTFPKFSLQAVKKFDCLTVIATVWPQGLYNAIIGYLQFPSPARCGHPSQLATFYSSYCRDHEKNS